MIEKPKEKIVYTISLEKFKEKFDEFWEVDNNTSPFSFHEFWEWKLNVETDRSHILDDEHRKEALRKLGETLKLWAWHRPLNLNRCLGILKHSLRKMSDAYNQIRSYSLLEFSDVPKEQLELIWHELGRVKEEGAVRNPNGHYLVMSITKPLMFLWGQTVAFDSVVRERIPRFDVRGLENDHWIFCGEYVIYICFLSQPRAHRLIQSSEQKM